METWANVGLGQHGEEGQLLTHVRRVEANVDTIGLMF